MLSCGLSQLGMERGSQTFAPGADQFLKLFSPDSFAAGSPFSTNTCTGKLCICVLECGNLSDSQGSHTGDDIGGAVPLAGGAAVDDGCDVCPVDLPWHLHGLTRRVSTFRYWLWASAGRQPCRGMSRSTLPAAAVTAATAPRRDAVSCGAVAGALAVRRVTGGGDARRVATRGGHGCAGGLARAFCYRKPPRAGTSGGDASSDQVRGLRDHEAARHLSQCGPRTVSGLHWRRANLIFAIYWSCHLYLFFRRIHLCEDEDCLAREERSQKQDYLAFSPSQTVHLLYRFLQFCTRMLCACMR
mmetsp:Transcript_24427/g.51142  ORF Transcript_24427/g.51142 Transcript_24427/m.51142 type:complete len:300 (+) Transcript_24427:233-1132(+)